MFADAIAAAALATPSIPATVPTVPGLGLHIDGDYLAYYASGNDETTQGESRENALNLMDRFKSRVGADHIIMHNTARGCHKGERYLIATVKPYQAQRVGGRKPKNHGYLQEWLQNYDGPIFRAKNWTSREADDGIGACAHHGTSTAHGYIAIATADKDMRMLPGLHISWLKGIVTRVLPGAYDVIGEDGKQYGLKFFFLQMLMGDTADNCPGLEHYATFNPDSSFKANKACGEKTAAKFLEGCKTTDEAFATVLKLYRTAYRNNGAGVADDRFCEQAALMWMRLDMNAAIGDFARHEGHSTLRHLFDAPLWEAVERMENRVQRARAEINELSN